MKRLLTPIVALLMSGPVPVTGRTTDLADTRNPVGVGVAQFEHEGYGAAGVASTARGLVEQELAYHSRIGLIERAHLADLLEEIGFQQSGVTPNEGADETGASGNVQLLIFGPASRRPPQEYRLALRIVDVATGRVLRAEETVIPSEGPKFEQTIRVSAGV